MSKTKKLKPDGQNCVWVLRLCTLLILLLLFVPGTPNAYAQIAGGLELIKTIEGDLTTVESGETFTYVLRYRCVGITQNCRNVRVRDVLPPELAGAADDVTLVGTVHTVSQSYNPATRVSEWVFIDPLPAGSTGELRMQVHFPPGSTPDGTTTINQATATSNNSPPQASNSGQITATATNQLRPQKTVFGGVPGEDTVYQVQLCRPADIIGQLNMSNITMVDTLPNGVTFVNASDGGTYDPGPPARVTWNLPDFDVNDDDPCITRTVTIRFPPGSFNLGDTVTNELAVTGTPTGQNTPVTSTTNVTHSLVPGNQATNFNKTGNMNDATIGQPIRFAFVMENTGNVPLDDAVIRDVIPPQLNVTDLHTGDGATTTVPIAICYETNLDPICTPLSGSPFTTSTSRNISSLGLAAGEYITAIEWDYGAGGVLPPGFSDTGSTDILAGFNASILAVDRNGNPVPQGFTVQNIGTLTTDYNGNVNTSVNDHSVVVTAPTARPIVNKAVISGDPADPLSFINYRIETGNAWNGTYDLVNPVIADLLDPNVIFQTWTFDPYTTSPAAPPPLFESIDNYNGTGRTLVRWRWQGASAYSFRAGQRARINYIVQVREGAPSGANIINNRAYVIDWDTSIPRISCPPNAAVQDFIDIDGDGDTTEFVCYSNQTTVTINSQAVMQSVKLVKGDLDTDYHRYPDFGTTSLGGTFEYRLLLGNVGNVPTTDIVIVDILPYVGDTGVIDTSARLSEWRPVLDVPIVPPPGTTVEYSTESNPCRPEVVSAGPVGCSAPNWSLTPPADLSTVQSLRIDMGTLILNPLDTIAITWIMRTPVGVARPGQITWNSFAFGATRVDTGQPLLPSEPFKVGVTVGALRPFGEKAISAVQLPEVEWRMVWINNNNVFPVNLQVFDPIPTGTTFVPNSLRCLINGSSTSSICTFDAPNNRIVWQGTLAPDAPGTTVQNAVNHLLIYFRVTVPDDLGQVSNTATSVLDTNGNSDFTDEDAPIANQVTNAVVWDRQLYNSNPAQYNLAPPPTINPTNPLAGVTILPSTGQARWSAWRVPLLAGSLMLFGILLTVGVRRIRRT